MSTNNVWSHIEHALAGAALVSVPLLINNIPDSWQTITLGAAIGWIWSLARVYLSGITAN